VIGLYEPGNSWLHRLGTGWKFLALMLVTTALSLTGSLYGQGAWLLFALALYPLAGLSLKHAWRTWLGLLPFFVVIIAVQWATASWQAGVWIASLMYIAVLIAGLLTLTTQVSAMLALFERLLLPLARFGVNPWKVSLVLALTIRCIPSVSRAVSISRDAWKARGLGRPSFRIITPVLVRLIRDSEAIGDAIAARGLERDPALDPPHETPLHTQEQSA